MIVAAAAAMAIAGCCKECKKANGTNTTAKCECKSGKECSCKKDVCKCQPPALEQTQPAPVVNPAASAVPPPAGEPAQAPVKGIDTNAVPVTTATPSAV